MLTLMYMAVTGTFMFIMGIFVFAYEKNAELRPSLVLGRLMPLVGLGLVVFAFYKMYNYPGI